MGHPQPALHAYVSAQACRVAYLQQEQALAAAYMSGTSVPHLAAAVAAAAR